jgi:YVTN family beta-propeller protein
VLGTISLPSGSHPHGIALSAAGDAAYVAFHGDAHDGHTVGVLNTAALSLTSQIELAPGGIGPNGVALAGSPAKVVVANRQTANAAAVDPGAGTVYRWLAAGAMPDGVAVGGNYGYVANFGNDTVTVFDAASLTVTGELHVGHEPALFATDSTTGDVYLSLHGANAVARLHDGMVAGQINDIPAPYGVAFDAVNRRLYVANRGGAQTVTVINVDDGVLGTIGVGKEPFVLAVNPDSGHLFVACGDEVKVYRTLDWALVTSIPAPAGAEEGIAVDSARDRVYVTSGEGDAVTVIQDAAAPEVLFVSSRDGNGEIYRMLPDGRAPKRLTTTAAWENVPAGSPDGRWIAYERTDEGGVAHLWVMSRDGLGARQLTSGAATDLHPTWSADGQWLAFASDRAGNWEIYRLRLADGYLERLTYNTAADLSPAWSWATGRIFFQSSRSSPNGEIFSMAGDGSDVRRLTVNSNGDAQPSPSPAGDRVVFWGTRGEQTLYVLMSDGVTILPLVSRNLRPGAAAWGPANAGGVIVFGGYRPGNGHSEIFRVAPDGSGLALLTLNEVDWDYAPGWLPAP